MAGTGRKKFNKFSAILIAVVIIIAVSVTFFSNKSKSDWKQTYRDYEIAGDTYAEKYPFSVHFIDVSQGDCTLIKSDWGNILIDCGEADEKAVVEKYLNNIGIEKIDYLFASHPHSDHIGCMSGIVEDYKIGKFYMSEVDESDIPTSSCYEKLLTALDKKNVDCSYCKAGDTLNIGEIHIDILAPVKTIKGDLNNNSTVMKITYDGLKILMTGDCGNSEEKTVLEKGYDLDCDILKVGHHGSRTSSSYAFLKAATPDTAVICVGEGNSYKHPHGETLEKLTKYCKSIFRTDINGSVAVYKNGNDKFIKVEKEG